MNKLLLLLPLLYCSFSLAVPHEISSCSNHNGNIQLLGSEDGFEVKIMSTTGTVNTYKNSQVIYKPRTKLNAIETTKIDVKCDADINVQQHTLVTYFTEGFTLTLKNAGHFDVQEIGPTPAINDVLICRTESYELGPCDK